MSDHPLPDSIPDGPEAALDIQHDTDPAEDHGPARRIPNLGHALVFFSLAWLVINLSALVCFLALGIHDFDLALQHPGTALVAQFIGYVVTLLLSYFLFPLMWHRSFLHGIQWNVLGARRRWYWLVLAGMSLSAAAQFADHFVKAPDSDLMSKLMHTTAGAWGVTLFGVFLAPLAEEIGFRGFLLPALATAYDWLSLERSPAGLRRWENSAGHTLAAVIFASVFSSIPFALLHAGQLHHAWGAVSVIFGVSLVLSFVRVRTMSVAASTLTHACYNATIFVAVIIATGGYRHLDKL
jgi:membrane protease YdiL (CAAX protease family)